MIQSQGQNYILKKGTHNIAVVTKLMEESSKIASQIIPVNYSLSKEFIIGNWKKKLGQDFQSLLVNGMKEWR